MKQRVLPVVFSVLAAAALVPSAASAVTAPASDPFYAQPANIAQYPHGTILREREVTLSGPTQVAAAAVYQLMYATTNATGQPVAAVTTVMVPTSPAPGPLLRGLGGVDVGGRPRPEVQPEHRHRRRRRGWQLSRFRLHHRTPR